MLFISIHAPREAERQFDYFVVITVNAFQSTLRVRRSDTFNDTKTNTSSQFQSTLRVRRSDQTLRDCPTKRRISIHAPREAERLENSLKFSTYLSISIHAPREAERLCTKCRLSSPAIFQSTLRVRRSDNSKMEYTYIPKIFQSTLRVRRSDLHLHEGWTVSDDFNPRSARGGATGEIAQKEIRQGFQSTLRARRSDHTEHNMIDLY